MVLNKFERVETYLSTAALTAAAVVFSGGLLFESRPLHKIFLSGSAIALSTTGLILSKTKGEEARRYNQLAINSQWEKALILSEHSLEDMYKRLHPRAAKEWQEAELIADMPALPPAEENNKLYNWDNLADNSSGMIIAGGTGFGKSTSVIAALEEFTKQKPGYVLVYDKHARRNAWKDYGLTAYHDMHDIENGLISIGEELKARQDRDENGPPIYVVIDELISAKKAFSDWKRINGIIEDGLVEGRKFDITFILLTQSLNCKAIGLDQSIRANAFWIALGELARREVAKGSDEHEFLSQQAYPCVVSGCVPTQVALHPTHSHHTEFKKKDKVPKFRYGGKIHQLQGDPFEFTRLLQGRESGEVGSDRNQPQQSQQPKPTDKINLDKTPEPPTAITLEAIFSADDDLPASVFSSAEWELLGLAGETGSITVRDAQNSNLARREGWDGDKIKSLFSRFAELGLGSIHHGARGVVEFRVNGGQGND